MFSSEFCEISKNTFFAEHLFCRTPLDDCFCTICKAMCGNSIPVIWFYLERTTFVGKHEGEKVLGGLRERNLLIATNSQLIYMLFVVIPTRYTIVSSFIYFIFFRLVSLTTSCVCAIVQDLSSRSSFQQKRIWY